MKGRDLTGLRIGKLTVLEPTDERIHHAIVWHCRCDCGNEIFVESRKLKPGVTESCGCAKASNRPVKDLTGLRFGKLTVTGRSPNRAKDRNPLWICRCDCGAEIETTKAKLISGNTRSCGCGRKPPLKDWVGKRFGRLTILSYAGKEKGFHMWRCRCDCGNIAEVRQSNLQRGWTTSCGCMRSPQNNLHYIDGTCVELLKNKTMYQTNTSGVRGVYYSRQRSKWIAQIMFKQKCYNLGGYDTLEEAAGARAEAEERLFGDFLLWYEEEYSQRNKK